MNTDAEGKTAPANGAVPVLRKDWRFYSGLAALGWALVLPLLALAVPFLDLPAGFSAVLIGGLVAGGPEVLILLAAALLGKEVLHYFTQRLKQVIWKAALVAPVSKTRYYVGLALSLLSLLPFYLVGYFPDIMPSGNARLYILVGSDASFILSVFLMGGEFWEKLRKIFVWEGKA